MPSESTYEQLVPHIKEFSTTTQQFLGYKLNIFFLEET